MTQQNEGSFSGPDEGGLLGENTAYQGGHERMPSAEQLRIDAARGHPYDPSAGPDSSAITNDADQRRRPRKGP